MLVWRDGQVEGEEKKRKKVINCYKFFQFDLIICVSLCLEYWLSMVLTGSK